MKKKTKILLGSVLIVLLALAVGCGVYVSDYYRADAVAFAALEGSEGVTVTQTEDRAVFLPREVSAGLIFYPGGKVEYTAYAPLMLALAEQEILCVLVEMPGNLAVLDMAAAEGIPEQFPEAERWYLGGHSLGGSMAASYLADHAAEYEGLVLLAAYSTADLAATNLKVLSLYGSEDGVLNREKYAEYRPNLPESAIETVIQGGNHALFGSYGPQEGDGQPTISSTEQLRLTADAIAALLG